MLDEDKDNNATKEAGAATASTSLVFDRAQSINVAAMSSEVPFLPEESPGVQMEFGRRFIFLLFEHPSTTVSKWISIFVFFLILLSSFAGFIESVPEFRYPRHNLQTEDESMPSFDTINTFCMILFVIEYMARFLTAHACFLVTDMELDEKTYGEIDSADNPAGPIYRTWVWFQQPMSLIDFFAILPFLFRIVPNLQNQIQQAVALRYFRLIRVFRVMKLQKQTISVALFVNTILKSAGPLSVLIFFLAMCIVVFGSICFNLERGVFYHYRPELDSGNCGCELDDKGDVILGGSCGIDTSSMFCCDSRVDWDPDSPDDVMLGGCWMRKDFYGDDLEKTPFTSVFLSMWWVLTTITTVGYGDMYPTTIVGRLCGAMAMVLGVIGFAMPITIIGTTFSEEYEHLTSGAGAPKYNHTLDIFTEVSPDFATFDTDQTGTLRRDQLHVALRDKVGKLGGPKPWTQEGSDIIYKSLFSFTDLGVEKEVDEKEYLELIAVLNRMKKLFGDRFKAITPQFLAKILESAWAGPTDSDRGRLTIRDGSKDAGQLQYPDDSVPDKSTETRTQVNMVAPTPAPANALEAPTPTRRGATTLPTHTTSYITTLNTHHRPHDFIDQTKIALSSQNAEQLFTLQTLVSKELCRRLHVREG